MVNIGTLLECLKNFGIIASVYYEPTRDHFDIIIGHHNVSEYEKNTDLTNQCITDNFNFTSINVASYTSLLGDGFLNDEQRERHEVSLFDGLPSIEEAIQESIEVSGTTSYDCGTLMSITNSIDRVERDVLESGIHVGIDTRNNNIVWGSKSQPAIYK